MGIHRLAFPLFLAASLTTTPAAESLLPRGATTWRYHDGPPLTDTTWRTGADATTDWNTGAAPLGYGDPGLATTLTYGDNSQAKHLTAYFATTATWTPADTPPASIGIFVRCDDGAVVYLNGQEVARQNMPAGTVTGTTPAAAAIAGQAETRFNRFLVPLTDGLLKEGANTITAEVHQASPSSSDLVFDLGIELYAEGEEPAVDHFNDGIAAFRRGDIDAGARHFAAVPADDPNFGQAAMVLVEQVFAPSALDMPERGLAAAKAAYEKKPGDLEVVRAYVRAHVLAEHGLTFPLKDRPLKESVPQEFRFLQKPAPDLVEHTPSLTAEQVAADLDYLELMIDNAYSYAERRGVDWKTALDVVRGSLAGRPSTVGELAFKLHRFLTLFGDPHTALRVAPGAYAPSGAAPFLAVPHGDDRTLAVEPDRSAFLDPDHPYLAAIDGKPVTEWLAAAAHFTPRASPQFQRDALHNTLRSTAMLRTELDLPAAQEVTLTVENADRSSTAEHTLTLTGRTAFPGPWPRRDTGRLDGDIGYLRIPSMRSDAAHIQDLNRQMQAFRDTRGLVIDVRDNGGGSQDTLKTLLPYFLEPGSGLRVVNVAAYRLPVKLPHPNPAGFLGLYGRGLHPVTSDVWSDDEKQTITAFLQSFQPTWDLPAGKFSAWHAMGVRPSNNPDAYHYTKPTVILTDPGCFSATDNFLGAFKGLPNVTLLGTPSGGGSGRMQPYTLPGSNIPLTLCQMASFARDGNPYDGHGVHPDILLHPAPEDALTTGPDTVLQAALTRLRQ